jgi:YbgC/YbaW family acyl-CoA thioester hydrolase
MNAEPDPTLTRFRTSRRVEFVDTDMAGIVHYSNFFRFMEAAEVSFLQSRGLSVALSWEGKKLGLPRVSAQCDFFKPAYFEDIVDIDVILKKVGRKSITYEFEISRAGELLARGQVICVCCLVLGPREIESVEIPEGLRAKLQGPVH